MEQIQQLPTVMQNIGIALLTVFIPMAISLFEKRDENFANLDRAVILDHLVNAPFLIGKLGLIFLPLLFWDNATSSVKSFLIFLWAIGVAGVILVLVRTFQWIRNNKYKFRFEYLESIEDKEDLEELWRSVWDAKDVNFQNEKKFFLIFTKNVDLLIVSDNLKKLNVATKLINDFQILINRRNFLSITTKDDVFSKILDWHSKVWLKEFFYIEQNSDINLYGAYSEILRTLNLIITSLTERAIQANFSYGFFKILEEHTNDNLDKKIDRNKNQYFYINNLLPQFFRTFFNKISESDQKYTIWHDYFPHEWKIRKEGILKGNKIQLLVLEEFIEWIRNKLWSESDDQKFDTALDGVARELFPDTEPRLWAIILTFILRPWVEDNRMQSLVENHINFGFIGRMYSGYNESHEEVSKKLRINIENQTESTMELAFAIFGGYLTKELINKSIQELKELSYENDSKKEKFRQEVLEYFKKLLEKLPK